MKASVCRAPLALLLLITTPMLACVSTVPALPDDDTHSIRFTARSAIATANGRFHRWRVVLANVDPTDVASSVVEIEIEVASVDTGMEGRDDHLRDPDYFETDRWPTARVRVHDARSDGETDDGRARYKARFDVTIRDHSRPLEGVFSVVSESPLVVEGSVVIDRVEFGVGEPDSGWNPMLPGEEVQVTFRATLD